MRLGERALSGVTERELMGDEGVDEGVDEANEIALKNRDARELVLDDEGKAPELTLCVPALEFMDP
jgi:hypothetical protein